MRVLHVSQPTTEGVAAVVAAHVRDQVRRGWDVGVACPEAGGLAAAAAAAGAVWHPWPAARAPGPSTPAEVARLQRVLRRARPDLVHLHSAKAGLAGRLGRRPAPVVFTPHAWSWEAAAGPVRVAALAWERRAARRTDLLLTVSWAELAQGAAAGVRVRRCAVVANGVDLARWAPGDAAARARARAALGLDDGPLVVCVGRLCHQKGQDALLAAWPSVRAAVPGAALVLVGDGPDRAALAAAAGPGVQLAGPDPDPAPWYAAADVVVVPSRWEGMALVPLEAMASARSVVGTDVAGVAESVVPGTGAVVPPGARGALVTALVDRLDGTVDADVEGRAGRAHVERAHDLRRVGAEVRAAYEAVVRRGGAPPR